MSFEGYFSSKIPDWMGSIGDRLARAVGHYVDGAHAHALVGVRARFFRYQGDYDGALAEHGFAAAICKHPSESSTSYAYRVGNRWESKQWSGTAKAVLDDLVSLGLDGEATMVSDSGDSWTYVGGVLTSYPGIKFDESDRYSRFFILTQNQWGEHSWGEPGLSWGDPGVNWGSDISADEFRSIGRVAWIQKSAHAIPRELAILKSGRLWGEPGLQWGGVGLAYADADALHVPLAQYYDDHLKDYGDGPVGGPLSYGAPELVWGAKPGWANCPQ